MNIDNIYMKSAIELALRAEGRTSPNPLVGAVIVKNGVIVGRGYHKECGQAHAEINAIRDAGDGTRGATMYVTLEPCNHFGRTPPCTDAIVKSGIKEVVIAMRDPNPLTNGRGIKKLNKYGIKTRIGVMAEEAITINKPFIKFITKKLPFITLKLAQSIDGKIATKSGDSRWITGEDSRQYVHKARAKVDAVMVGVNTIIRDDPSLLSRIKGAKSPARIIVDSKLRTPINSAILSDAKNSMVVIAVTKSAISKKIEFYNKKGALILFCKSRDGMVDLKDLMKNLAGMNITNILAEGGGELAASLLRESLVDRFMFFIAPKIVGGRNARTSVEGSGINKMIDAIELKNINMKNFKRDILIEAEA